MARRWSRRSRQDAGKKRAAGGSDDGPRGPLLSRCAPGNHMRETQQFARVWTANKKGCCAAMDAVDQAHTSRPTVRAWGYWVRELTIFVRGYKERADPYFMIWWRVRPGWRWRDFWYGETGRQDRHGTTANAQRADHTIHVFRHTFKAEEVDMNPTVPPLWFGHRFTSFVSGKELMAMVQLLVPACPGEGNEDRREDMVGRIFPDRSLYSFKQLPSRNAPGLGAPVPHARVAFLEAFRAVLSRWPKRVACIYQASPIPTNLTGEDILWHEEELARFHITTFYETSDHAPIIPHTFPKMQDARFLDALAIAELRH
ncbi:hypothetical protein C8Q73DRAFT_669895 [Cubamyces lactineus]|nr:hypothetical protein C8Q73DRAFT_669895 [Cubamyces lactineus]